MSLGCRNLFYDIRHLSFYPYNLLITCCSRDKEVVTAKLHFFHLPAHVCYSIMSQLYVFNVIVAPVLPHFERPTCLLLSDTHAINMRCPILPICLCAMLTDSDMDDFEDAYDQKVRANFLFCIYSAYLRPFYFHNSNLICPCHHATCAQEPSSSSIPETSPVAGGKHAKGFSSSDERRNVRQEGGYCILRVTRDIV